MWETETAPLILAFTFLGEHFPFCTQIPGVIDSGLVAGYHESR